MRSLLNPVWDKCMVIGVGGPGIGIDIGLARSRMYGCILLVMVWSIYLKV